MVLKGLFDGWAEHRKSNPHDDEYEYFNDTPFLHTSKHMEHMYNRAANEDQKYILLEYMERNGVDSAEYKGYYSVANQIKLDLGIIEEEPFTPAQRRWLIQQFNKGEYEC